MQYLMIGMAGHIDHGKTALVKALTGVDTDRLAEEKRRRISIDLGFAQLRLSNMQQAGIIDLPGHLDYIKNMMAGASGIDLALMSIAADEGIMPQTLEHLEILSQFGVKYGVIALTKCDLVEKNSLQQMRTSIKKTFSGSFLKDAPVVEVSAVTGQGISQLRNALAKTAEKLPLHITEHPYWMPIDRVFTVAGFGTVATGTVLDGRLRVGEMIRLLPEGSFARVRGLQSGGIAIPAVFAGQRAAVNLTGVKLQQICRGSTLTASPFANVYTHLDVRLDASPHMLRPLRHGVQLHLAIGTDYQLCRLCLLEGEQILPGERKFAQLRLQKPMAARKQDHFVLWDSSQKQLAGGGVILALDPPHHHRLDKQVLERLHLSEQGTLAQNLLYETARQPQTLTQLSMKFWHLSKQTVQKICEDLVEKGALQQSQDCYLETTRFLHLQKELISQLMDWHRDEPFSGGMPQSLLQTKYPNLLLCLMEKKGDILRKDGKMLLNENYFAENTCYLQTKQRLQQYCMAKGFCGITLKEALQQLPLSKKQAQQALQQFLQEGFLVQLPDGTLLLKSTCILAWEQTMQVLTEQGKITLAQLRDLLQISRKYAQPILEWFDLMGWTCRIEDYRVLNKEYK